MIPENLTQRWELEVARLEVLFLADHGGGCPEALARPDMTPAARRVALGRLGFRVAEEYAMPRDLANLEEPPSEMVPWVRLTNGVAVELETGFVARNGGQGKQRRGRCG